MISEVRAFLEFWTANSVHARDPSGLAGAEQGASHLVHRLIQAAGSQGISKEAMIAEAGDLTRYITGKLKEANQTENDRR
jgi:hypothetical protein